MSAVVAVKPILKQRGTKSSGRVNKDAHFDPGANSGEEYKDESAAEPSGMGILLLPDDADATGML